MVEAEVGAEVEDEVGGGDEKDVFLPFDLWGRRPFQRLRLKLRLRLGKGRKEGKGWWGAVCADASGEICLD